MTDRTKEEITKDIESVIEKYVQPAVDSHGGVVKLENFDMDSGKATMMMSGACSGCAGSQMTLKTGVENMVKHYVPEVKFIDSVADPAFNQPFYTTWDVLDKSMQEGKDEENGK